MWRNAEVKHGDFPGSQGHDAINEPKKEYPIAVKTTVKPGPLADMIMVWRVNSDNWVYENMLLVALYNKIHSGKSPNELDQKVKNGWDEGGRDTQGHKISPWTENDWIEAKEYYG